MAVITKSVTNNVVAVTELTGTDSLDVKSGSLFVFNNSLSPVTLTIDGDGGTTVDTKVVGSVDVSAGFGVTIAAGDLYRQPLGDISGYLSGTVAVTGGTAGVFAWVG